MQAQDLLNVIIREKDGLVWEGKAVRFSSTNELGNFDVLPDHAHFVSSIKDFIKITTSNGKKNFTVKTGIISVLDGILEVYLDC